MIRNILYRPMAHRVRKLREDESSKIIPESDPSPSKPDLAIEVVECRSSQWIPAAGKSTSIACCGRKSSGRINRETLWPFCGHAQSIHSADGISPSFTGDFRQSFSLAGRYGVQLSHCRQPTPERCNRHGSLACATAIT